jgi:type IV secretion system protein VirB5
MEPYGGGTPGYGPGDKSSSPYSKQAALWEDRIKRAERNAGTWRTMAVMELALMAALAGGLVYLANQTEIEAYVVEVDSRSGEPVRQAVLTEPFRPDEALVAGTLARWIEMTRAKSTDPIVVRQQWEKAYSFVSEAAKPMVDEYAKKIDPFGKIGNAAKTVEVRSVTRQSDQTFQVRWLETAFENGTQQETQAYTANITFKIEKPRNRRDLFLNPIGLYITALYVNRDFDASS